MAKLSNTRYDGLGDQEHSATLANGATVKAESFYASGARGKHVKADGKGGFKARGYYCKTGGRLTRGESVGPYATRNGAVMAWLATCDGGKSPAVRRLERRLSRWFC